MFSDKKGKSEMSPTKGHHAHFSKHGLLTGINWTSGELCIDDFLFHFLHQGNPGKKGHHPKTGMPN